MATVFLSGDNAFSVYNSVKIYGSPGEEIIHLNGAPGATLDANIKTILLDRPVADYQFKIDNTTITLSSSDGIVATFTGLNAPATLIFADGSVDLNLTGLGRADLGGIPLQNTFASIIPTLSSTTVDKSLGSGLLADPGSILGAPVLISGGGGSPDNIFFNQNDSLTLSSTAKVYGCNGGDEKVTILGSPGVQLDANFEQVFLGNNVQDYQFSIVNSTEVLVESNGQEVVRFSGLNNSVAMHFADGVADLSLTGLGRADFGGTAISVTPATVVPTVFVGSTPGNSINGSELDDRLIGTDGNDTIYADPGNDVLRGGAGVDAMYGEEGNDIFVIVGDLTHGGKQDSAGDTAILGQPLSSLNGLDFDEDAGGGAEVIDGGAGDDTLYVYGTADLTNSTLVSIEHIETRSDVSFLTSQLQQVMDVTGDGRSVIRLMNTGATQVELDLSQLNLEGIGQIDVGPNVTLAVSDLAQLGGARILTGAGAFRSSGAMLTLPDSCSIQNTLNFVNTNTAQADVLNAVLVADSSYTVHGSSGNDYMQGTQYDDTFICTAGGNDVMTGKQGSDTFVVAGSGRKIVLDVSAQDNGSDQDTLDLSQALSAANVDLRQGGTVGQADIQLGSGSSTGGTQQDAQQFNLMLTIDVSGSMAGTRMSDVKAAALQLLDAYDALGDVAVRLVSFSASAQSTFNGTDAWMDVAAARVIVNSLSALGGTYYDVANDLTMTAFSSGQGSAFLPDGNNACYFLSDGKPTAGHSIDAAKEATWENFLIENQITAQAIGFGGLANTGPLEPLAFDGIRVSSPTADHAAGEIPASIELDTTNLGNTMVSSANLDFIENLTGTNFNDTLTGNSLDNVINGGAGDDVIRGGGGNDTIDGGPGNDTVMFSGLSSDYTITDLGDTILFVDSYADRDGETLLKSVENASFVDSSIQIRPTSNTERIFDSTGYYTFFAYLAAASYTHTGVGSEAVPTLTPGFKWMNYQKIFDIPGFSLMTSSDLNLFSGNDTAFYFTGAILPTPSLVNYNYDFEDGFYGTDERLGWSGSFAMVGKTDDALFVTFRGTDVLTDWVDDVVAMQEHYAMYSALTAAIDRYLENHAEIERVYVGGHSLGGQMATLYMSEHYGDSKFYAVEFEAANKLVVDNNFIPLPLHNNNIVGIEMPQDPVPDLGVDRGYVIDVNLLDGWTWPFELHGMDKVLRYTSEYDDLPRAGDLNLDLTTAQIDDRNGAFTIPFIDTLNAIDVVGTGTSIVVDGNDGETYKISDDLFPIDNLEFIIAKDDVITFSENVNVVLDVNDPVGRLIVGNSGNNLLAGGAGDDGFVGGADKDFLVGGMGSDILFGGRGSFVAGSEADLLVREYATGMSGDWTTFDVEDVDFFMGGQGPDEIYAGVKDNDFIFVDSDLSKITDDSDHIYDFSVTEGLLDLKEDYLIFSASDFGIAPEQYRSFGTMNLDVSQWFGADVTAYQLPFRTHLPSVEEHFFKVDGIANYKSGDAYLNDFDSLLGVVYDAADSLFSFVLDTLTGDLYFDADGNRDYGDEVKVANLSVSSAGDQLVDMHANQILIVDSFDFAQAYA